MILAPRIDPAQAEIDRLRREVEFLRGEVERSKQEVLDERQEWSGVAEGVQELTQTLGPLFNAMKKIFREIQATGLETASTAPSSTPRKAAIWDSWKAKLPSGEGKAIDALLLHGKLKTDQIRIHIGCATRTATNIVSSLKSKGLVVKDGAHYSLKEL